MPGPVLVVPTRTLVMASETQPSRFRPANQLRLQPAQATNPATHGGTNFMPSFLDYRGANAINDMGLGWRKSRAQKVPHANQPTSGWASYPSRPMGAPGATAVPTTNSSPLSTPATSPVAMAGLGSMFSKAFSVTKKITLQPVLKPLTVLHASVLPKVLAAVHNAGGLSHLALKASTVGAQLHILKSTARALPTQYQTGFVSHEDGEGNSIVTGANGSSTFVSSAGDVVPINSVDPSVPTTATIAPAASTIEGLGAMSSMETLGISIGLGLAVGGAIWWFIKRKKK